MSAISVPDPALRGEQARIVLEGEIPSPRNPPPGCPFHPRCRYAEEKCAREMPPLAPAGEGERFSACFFPDRVQPVFNVDAV